MIELDEATRIAQAHLAARETESTGALALAHEATRFGPGGWLFFWNSKERLEGGSISSALAGNTPLLVDHGTGAVSQLDMTVDWSEYEELA